MSSNVDLSALSSSLSPSATLVVSDENFASTYDNWTNYGLQTPLAVVKPTSEADILAAIRFAAGNSLRVSARAGGHSCFNTVARGIVIDLATYGAVTYDEASQTVTMQGGAKTGDVLAVLAKNNRCSPTGNCNAVGFVPLCISGGFGPLKLKLGMGIDSIISARLLLSTGEAIDASSTQNADVFEAICGGGQALGIVSELKIATYPLAETMGSADGSIWSGTIAFPAERAADVACMLENFNAAPETNMLMSIALPPPELGMPLTAPMIIFMLGYLGSDAQADAAFADIDALGPAVRMAQRVPYVEVNNRYDALQEMGGFKRFFGVGLEKISARALTEMTQQFAELVARGPDFAKTCVLFEMLGVERSVGSSVGIYPHRSLKYQCIPFGWYSDPTNHDRVGQWGVEARNAIKAGDATEKVVVYSNFRQGAETAEEVWGSKETANKLKAMKKRLDPVTMFQSLNVL